MLRSVARVYLSFKNCLAQKLRTGEVGRHVLWQFVEFVLGRVPCAVVVVPRAPELPLHLGTRES